MNPSQWRIAIPFVLCLFSSPCAASSDSTAAEQAATPRAPEVAKPQPAQAAADPAGPCPICWHAQPAERCRTILLTNFGSYMTTGLREGGIKPRGLAEVGVLFNAGARSAFGATMWGSYDTDEFSFGPQLRYRRWLGGGQSLDFGLGVPLFGSEENSALVPYGLIKYNVSHWVGVAVRPEVRRYRVVDFCDSTTCNQIKTHFVMSGGLEFGWIPGLALFPASGIVALLVLGGLSDD